MNIKELIPKYLNGLISELERKEFEKVLEENKKLQQEFDEIKDIYVGLKSYDHISEGHIDSMQLSIYSENQNELDYNTQKEIEEHLSQCEGCKVEFDICNEVNFATSKIQETKSEEKESLLDKFIELLFPKQLFLRSAISYLAIFLLVFTSFLNYEKFLPQYDDIKEFNISATSLRGEQSQNLIKVGNKNRSIQVTFTTPINENNLYNVSIVDSADSKIITYYKQKLRNPISLEISLQFLTEGKYSIVLDELNRTGAVVDISHVSFEIKYID